MAEAITTHISVKLVHVFGGGLRAKGLADLVFHVRKTRVVAICAAAGVVDKEVGFGVPRSNQHTDKASHVACDGVFHAVRHAASYSLVQNEVNAYVGCLAAGQVSDASLHKGDVLPLRWGDYALHIVEVSLVSGG